MVNWYAQYSEKGDTKCLSEDGSMIPLHLFQSDKFLFFGSFTITTCLHSLGTCSSIQHMFNRSLGAYTVVWSPCLRSSGEIWLCPRDFFLVIWRPMIFPLYQFALYLPIFLVFLWCVDIKRWCRNKLVQCSSEVVVPSVYSVLLMKTYESGIYKNVQIGQIPQTKHTLH